MFRVWKHRPPKQSPSGSMLQFLCIHGEQPAARSAVLDVRLHLGSSRLTEGLQSITTFYSGSPAKHDMLRPELVYGILRRRSEAWARLNGTHPPQESSDGGIFPGPR